MCCLNFKPVQITKIISIRTLILTRKHALLECMKYIAARIAGGGGFSVNGKTRVFGKNSEFLPIRNAVIK